MFDKRLGDLLTVPSLGSTQEDLRAHLRPSVVSLAKTPVHMVRTGDEAVQMASTIERLPVAFVGMDAEFRFGAPADDLENDWQDLTQLKPISIGLAVVVRDNRGCLVTIRFAVDVRQAETMPGVERVLHLPVKFICHFFKAEYLAVMALGLTWPRAFFCTWVAARLLTLGQHHARYGDPNPEDDVAEAIANDTAKARRRSVASLLELTRRFGVVYPFMGDKQAMRQRYLHLDENDPLTIEDGAYVTADAYAAAALHLPLRVALVKQGLDHHYDHVELPAALEFAEIERQGVTVNRSRIQLARNSAKQAVRAFERQLAGCGFRVDHATPQEIAKGMPTERVIVRSFNERYRILGSLGLLKLFRSRKAQNEFSFRRELLKRHREVHPVIDMLYRHAKFTGITRERLFDGEFICADGRVHPWINPLGADSGRPSFSRGNLVGVGKVLRPIVVPSASDRGLAELDFVAEEVFIAAAVFNDQNLLEDCNTGDPYMKMVRWFCTNELVSGDERLDDVTLAAKYPNLRARMKILMLAMMYGMGIEAIAAQAHISLLNAKRLKDKFFKRYHRLCEGMKLAVRQLRDRGYAETVTGMKRFRGQTGHLSGWETRWAVNALIQGGGACILKLLLPRLSTFLREDDSRIVLPIFDAVLIEFPLAVKEIVLRGAEQIMIESMRALYPDTRPRIDINVKDPTCWNKNGVGDSIERFLANPDFKL